MGDNKYQYHVCEDAADTDRAEQAMMLQEKEVSTPAARFASAIARAHRMHEEIDRATGDESSQRFLAEAIVSINTGTDHPVSWFQANISRYVAQSPSILSAIRLQVADRIVLALAHAQLLSPSVNFAQHGRRLRYFLNDINNLEKRTMVVLSGHKPASSLGDWLAFLILDLESMAFHIQNEIEHVTLRLSRRNDH